VRHGVGEMVKEGGAAELKGFSGEVGCWCARVWRAVARHASASGPVALYDAASCGGSAHTCGSESAQCVS